MTMRKRMEERTICGHTNLTSGRWKTNENVVTDETE